MQCHKSYIYIPVVILKKKRRRKIIYIKTLNKFNDQVKLRMCDMEPIFFYKFVRQKNGHISSFFTKVKNEQL